VALDDARRTAIADEIVADEREPTLYDIVVRHGRWGGTSDIILHSPTSVEEIVRRLPALGEVLREGAPSTKRVFLTLPDKPIRMYNASQYDHWVGLIDHALATIGDPRRLVALLNPEYDVGEQAHFVATPAQAALLEAAGWTEPQMSGGPLEEVRLAEDAASLAPRLSMWLRSLGCTCAAEARGDEVAVVLDESAYRVLLPRLNKVVGRPRPAPEAPAQATAGDPADLIAALSRRKITARHEANSLLFDVPAAGFLGDLLLMFL
jgi:hypothetical protein